MVIGINPPRTHHAGLLAAKIRLRWMRRVITVHLRAVVIIPAAHFDDRVDAPEHVIFRRRVADRTQRVELLHEILHRAGHVRRLRRVLHHELLVGDTPKRHARMIAVAADLVFPLFHIRRIAAHQPALIHDQQAEPVAGIQQFRRGRIMRHPVRVAAELLQFLHAKILQRIRDGRANAGMILVIARAIKFVMLAVQQKAVRRVKAHGANPERGFFLINQVIAH